jgi:hypothetical protein
VADDCPALFLTLVLELELGASAVALSKMASASAAIAASVSVGTSRLRDKLTLPALLLGRFRDCISPNASPRDDEDADSDATVACDTA